MCVKSMAKIKEGTVPPINFFLKKEEYGRMTLHKYSRVILT